MSLMDISTGALFVSEMEHCPLFYKERIKDLHGLVMDRTVSDKEINSAVEFFRQESFKHKDDAYGKFAGAFLMLCVAMDHALEYKLCKGACAKKKASRKLPVTKE